MSPKRNTLNKFQFFSGLVLLVIATAPLSGCGDSAPHVNPPPENWDPIPPGEGMSDEQAAHDAEMRGAVQ